MAGSSGNARQPTYDLFVANFPTTANEAVLMENFSKFGPIAGVVIREKENGAKFGFVKFVHQQSVDVALADTVYIGGNKIRCGPSARTNEKPRGGVENNHDTDTIGGYNSRKNLNMTIPGNRPDIVSFNHADGPPSHSNKPVQLFMTHVESPCVFWAQKPELAEVIANVERSLASVCPKACPLRTKPEPNKMYGTQFSLDNQWYRCEILRFISQDQCEVVYSDYGNKEVVDNDKIVELPDVLTQLNPLAAKYSLFGIQAVDDPVLFAKGMERLSLLKESSVLKAILYEPLNGVIPVKMKTCDGIDVIKEMINSKTCIPVMDVDACLISPEIRSIQPLMSKVQKIRDGSGDLDSGLVDRLEKELKQSQHELASMENLVQVRQEEAKAQRRDIDSRLEQALKQNVELSEKLRTLESQKQALEAELYMQADNTFSNKVARVFAGLQKVMVIRLQFQSSCAEADPIEEAITMATGSCIQTSLDKVPVLGQIDDARSRYQDLQVKLRMASEDAECRDLTAIDQMIADRNKARNEVFELLQEFIGLFSDVNALTSHESQIETLLATLELRYAPYLASQAVTDIDLDSTSKAYLVWKSEKEQKFADTRQMTDCLRSLVANSVGNLQKELLHRSSTVDLTQISFPDIDRMFDDFGSAIDTEMNLVNQVTPWNAASNRQFDSNDESAMDIVIIQRTLISLVSELRRKLENIRQLIKLRTRFLNECEEMSQWLSKLPDITRLQSTAKAIKGLKSKLRYGLAHLQDMKEDGLETSDEFRLAENDLAEIRGQLQQQLENEDEQLKWLSVLTLNHFPEMIVKHPELNLQKFIKFNGLLKSGHMLDQFQLELLPGCTKKSVYKSSYCGKSVVLKEFLQSDTSKTQFLKNVKKYSKLMSPRLAQLVAVFFGMNDRQAVVMLPCYEFNLTQLMENGTSGLVVPDKMKVLGSVLLGMNALHGMELVHGALHPNNVLVNLSLGDVVVADYDFTKTPTQRSENPFVTSSGLRFQAPELQLGPSSCQPSCLSDMYNFGLLILWVHAPQLASVPKCFPNSSFSSLDEDMAALVDFLLDNQPERRPGTDKILAVGYFTPDEPEEESFVAKEEASLAPQEPEEDSYAANTKEETFTPRSEVDDMGTSVDITGVETKGQLVEDISKDATEKTEEQLCDDVVKNVTTEESEVDRSSTEEQRLPESVEEHETSSENTIIEYDSRQDTGYADFKLEDVMVSEDCGKDI